jgi:hypothetical protein
MFDLMHPLSPEGSRVASWMADKVPQIRKGASPQLYATWRLNSRRIPAMRVAISPSPSAVEMVTYRLKAPQRPAGRSPGCPEDLVWPPDALDDGEIALAPPLFPESVAVQPPVRELVGNV